MSYISLKDIKHEYKNDDGETIVFDGLSIDIEKGEYIALLGRNGSGKSTLAKMINMIVVPDKGDIYIDGVKANGKDLNDEQILNLRKKIGLVFQNPDNQLISTVVEEDVAFGPENIGIESSEIRERVDSALEYVGMTKYAKHAPSRLSGGQKQRVAIAGVLALMPECIIFDEATSMLDPSGRNDILKLMKSLNKEKGITVIDITHDMEEASLADRLLILGQGRILADGKPEEIFGRVDFMVDAGLEVPDVTKLFYMLNKSGVNLDTEIIDKDKAAGIIADLISNGEK